MEATLATKLGNDANGNSIISELKDDGVSTSLCICREGLDSYVTQPVALSILSHSSPTSPSLPSLLLSPP